jgi:hypothetical protein
MIDSVLPYGLLLLAIGLAALAGLVVGVGIGERRGKRQVYETTNAMLASLIRHAEGPR